MYLMHASLNYHDLPIEERSQFVFNKDELADADVMLNQEKSILENIILSTCNRTELYAVVDQLHTGRYYLRRFLANWFHVDMARIDELVDTGSETETVTHLMRVTTGLDSMIVGEPQILGQMKQAFAIAQKAQTTGLIFNELFKEATTFAKRMHTKYRVSELSKSTSQAGLHQIKQHFGQLSGQRLLIIGTGMIGAQVARNASTMGFGQIILMNRTKETADALADEIGGVVRASDWSQMTDEVNRADAIVTAVGATMPIISGKMLTTSDVVSDGIVIDLGVPQNVDTEAVAKLSCYDNIDDLSDILDDNQLAKHHMIDQMAAEVPAAVAEFDDWQRSLPVVPIIRELRESSLEIESNTYNSLMRKLPQLDSHERKVISKHMKSIVNQMIKGPIVQIKDSSSEPDAAEHLDFFCRIFGFDRAYQQREQMTHEK